MSQTSAVYATKRRRRNGKPMKPQPTEVANSKSNPSKRHRLRLNAELDTLASLLPYEHNILSKLDRLSILRLAVAYLRTKSFFHMSMTTACKEEELLVATESSRLKRDGMLAYDNSLNSETFIQALNGFIFILDCEGEVFFSTHNIENFLGFHQSDIIHQSVFELVHSEDREELQRHFLWNSFLPPDRANMSLQEALLPDNAHLLERSFTVRFRCLLDNTSGFLRLDVRGRIRQLTGQNRSDDRPVLALFALCTPFGPPSLLETPHKDIMFKSKHRLDMTMVSLDQRGKALLGYSDDILNLSGYSMVHQDDLAYLASAHQELLKTGASGLIAYRLQTKQLDWQWLQTSSRLLYKNSKPDFIISTHRPLLEEEGIDLLAKRTMDFKVSYLDPGLTNQYLYDSEINSTGAALGVGGGSSAGSNGSNGSGGATKSGRRHKSQLRDFLTTSRSKRKHHQNHTQHPSPGSAPMVDYPADSQAAAAAAVYGQYAAVAAAGYPGGYTPAGYPASAVASGVYPGPEAAPLYANQSGMQSFQTLYPAIENRFLAADGLYYRQLSGYHYPGTEHHYAPHTGYNGLMDMSRSPLPVYDSPHTPASVSSGAPHSLQMASGEYVGSVHDVGPVNNVGKYPDDRSYLPRSPYYDSYHTAAIVPSAGSTTSGSSAHLMLNGVGLQHETGYSVSETNVPGMVHDEAVPVYITPEPIAQLHGTSTSQHHLRSKSQPNPHTQIQHHPQQQRQQDTSISSGNERLVSGDSNNSGSSSGTSNSNNSEPLSGSKSVISHTQMYGSGNESRQTVLVWSGSSTGATENGGDEAMMTMPLLSTATSSSSEAINSGSGTSTITADGDSGTRGPPDLTATNTYSPRTAASGADQQHLAAAAITSKQQQQQQQPTPCHQVSPQPLDSSMAPVAQWTPQRAEVAPTSPADAARLAVHPAPVYTHMGLTDSWTPYSVGYLPSPQAAEMYPSATARGGTVCCPSLRL